MKHKVSVRDMVLGAMKIRLMLFVVICCLGMAVVIMGCSLRSTSKEAEVGSTSSIGDLFKPVHGKDQFSPTLKRLVVGHKMPNWRFNRKNWDFDRQIDLQYATVIDRRVIIEGKLISGTVTIEFPKNLWIEYDGTRYICISPNCTIDALNEGEITQGIIVFYK